MYGPINNIRLRIRKTYQDQQAFLKAERTETKREVASFLAKAINSVGFVLGSFKAIPGYVHAITGATSYLLEEVNNHLGIREHELNIGALRQDINLENQEISNLERNNPNILTHYELSIVEGDWSPSEPRQNDWGTKTGLCSPAAWVSYANLALQGAATALTIIKAAQDEDHQNKILNYATIPIQFSAIAIPYFVGHSYKRCQNKEREYYRAKLACTETIQEMRRYEP